MNTQAALRLIAALRRGEPKASELITLMSEGTLDYANVMQAFWSGRGYSFEDAELFKIDYPDPALREVYYMALYIACIREGKEILLDWCYTQCRLLQPFWEDESNENYSTRTMEKALELAGITQPLDDIIETYGAQVHPFSRGNVFWVVEGLKRLGCCHVDFIFEGEKCDDYGYLLVRDIAKLGALKDKGHTLDAITASKALPRLLAAWELFGCTPSEISNAWAASGSMADFQLLIERYADEEGIDLGGFTVPHSLRFTAQEPMVTEIIENM